MKTQTLSGKLKSLKSEGRRLLALLLVFSNFVSLPSYAIEVQLGSGLRLQALSDDTGAGGETSEVLAAGSIVDIPPEFRVNDRAGQFDASLTLNNWLRNAGHVGTQSANHGGGLYARGSGFVDYFYPIRIVSAAPGSNVSTYNGRTYFLALRQLVQLPTNQLATRAATPVTRADSVLNADEAGGEGTGNCPTGTCRDSRTVTPAFNRLISDLDPILRRVSDGEMRNQRRTGGDFEAIDQRFQSSCGFSLSSFIPVVRTYAAAYGIPTDVVLSIMVQESSGRCYARGINTNMTSDSGLFGVNSHTAGDVPACSAYEIRQLYYTPARALANGPQCRENPVVNLQLSLKILKSKIDHLVVDSAHSLSPNGFERRGLVDAEGHYTRTAWRLAVSAYNGGEKWVITAKHDLDSFNRANGTQLDPYNWEDLRIFYLRRALSYTGQQRYFGDVAAGRNPMNTIANLSYTENIVPTRSSGSAGHATVAEMWHDLER